MRGSSEFVIPLLQNLSALKYGVAWCLRRHMGLTIYEINVLGIKPTSSIMMINKIVLVHTVEVIVKATKRASSDNKHIHYVDL